MTKKRIIKKWSADIKDNVKIDYVLGLTLKQIAIKYDMPFVTAFTFIDKAGIRRPKENPKGEKHPLWKGGTYVDKDNYIVTSGVGHIREHRTIIETVLERKLEHWEVVHHIDSKKDNNSLDNLVVMPTREHTRFHNFLYARGLSVNKESLIKYARKEGKFYYRFTTDDFVLQSGIPKKIKVKEFVKCKEDGCNKPVDCRKLCSRHVQRLRAKERGYWISGGGRKAKYKG